VACAECKYWLLPGRFDIVEDFEYRCTPRLRREVRKMIFEHFDRTVAARRSISEGILQSKTKPVLAKAIETTPDTLILIMESGSVSIPWRSIPSGLPAHPRRNEVEQCFRLPATASTGP